MNYDQKKIKEFTKIKKECFKILGWDKYDHQKLDADFLAENIDEGNTRHLKDFIWRCFNMLVSEHSQDFQMQSIIYKHMARFNIDYEDGKVAESCKKLSAEARLFYLEMNLPSIYNYRIKIAGFDCPICAPDQNKSYTLEEIKRLDLLPHKNCNCTKYGCQCEYNLAICENEDGSYEMNLDNMNPPKKEINLQNEGGKTILKIFNLFRKK